MRESLRGVFFSYLANIIHIIRDSLEAVLTWYDSQYFLNL